ncbi:MAG TPA: Gfo/Idh/MocA family oxidoreductase [Gammaproteobacteria bacterium]|jgi:predicted dehydrogenase|nr:Gfo/Idh/MocA family oxidoreductase [Gammaproteobacteria bacterium]HIL63458.1 Gfo/Idh/MocA family oxidoreductase [Porticoccaceae bacterium]
MSEDPEMSKHSKIKRRDFLSAAALPLAAAVVPASLTAQDNAAFSAPERVRVGIIGAGANVRGVQIPGFQRISGCEIVAVANRSLQSSQRVTKEFNIPRAYGTWEELLDDDDIDAVLIGTWPYMHRRLTMAVLESGKHVLCQARMANNAAEARDMLAASRRYPELVSQLVPTSTSYIIDNLIRRLLAEGYVGEVLSVEIQRLRRNFAELEGVLDWRHDREFSGYNTLNLGATYESMLRWFGPGDRVMAQTKMHVGNRKNADGESVAVAIPDHVDILYELTDKAQVHMRFSETTGLSSGNQTWIHGSEGTIYVDGRLNVLAGQRGDSELTPLANPPRQQAFYRVEEEFINAIRGVEEITMARFETGVQYMEWTEAVHLSAESGQAVNLPLA